MGVNKQNVFRILRCQLEQRVTGLAALLLNRSREEGKCKNFSTVLKMSGSSTKTFLVKSCNEAETPIKSKTSQIDSFFKKEKESLSEVIAQLVAKDGFSFSQIAKSELTRRAFKSYGFDIPISRQSVRN